MQLSQKHPLSKQHEHSYNNILKFTKWFAIIRYLTVVGIYIIILFIWKIDSTLFDPRFVLFIFLPIYLLISTVWPILAKKKAYLFLLNNQLLVDTLAVTVGIYLTGGLQSQFIFIYTGVVLSAAALSFRHILATIIATISLFGALGIGEISGLIPSITDEVSNISTEVDVRIAMTMLTMGIVAFQGYYLFSQIRKKDEEILKLKDQFLFLTVHDIRSPSTAIKWILEKYNSPESHARNPDIKDIISRLQKLNERVTNLAKNLSAIARGDSSIVEPKMKPLNIVSLMEGIVEETKSLAESKNIHVLHTPMVPHPNILGSVTLVKEVFVNLIDNGIKYNRESGNLTITYEKEGFNLKVIITDTGEGMTLKQQNQLFTAFYRGNDSRKDATGSGLGLYLVKKIVERIDGTISVNSNVGVGSSFTVTLPLASET